MTSEGVMVQSNNFTPVCIEFQQKIRDYFGWDIKDDEMVLRWLIENIEKYNTKWNLNSQATHLEKLIENINSKSEFVVIGANVTKSEIMELSANSALIVADGAIGALLELNLKLIRNVICLVSDGDGIPHINNEKIGGMTILLHAHGHAKDNLDNILNIWNKWEEPPKIIISHQTFENSPSIVNFGGFSDGDRAVCMLHACGISKSNIQIIGFNSQKVGPWSGISDIKKKREKLIWMEKILEELGHVV